MDKAILKKFAIESRQDLMVKIKNKNKQTRISFLGLPLFKVKHKNGVDKIYLFNCLPLFSKHSNG